MSAVNANNVSLIALLLALAAIPSCWKGSSLDSDEAPSTDADTDSDTDTDVDSDTDSDGDTDSDTDVDVDSDSDVDGDTDADSDHRNSANSLRWAIIQLDRYPSSCASFSWP